MVSSIWTRERQWLVWKEGVIFYSPASDSSVFYFAFLEEYSPIFALDRRHTIAPSQVFADAEDALKLIVGWDAPTTTNGADIVAHVVELAPSSNGWSEPYLTVTTTVVEAMDAAKSVNVGGKTYAAVVQLDADDVTCGDPWAARVRAVNEMGEGPPEWYPTVVRGNKLICTRIIVGD